MMVGHYLGLNFQYIEVEVATGEHLKEDFLDKNPMHSIPVLDDRGFIVADSHAIVTYLVSKFGADKRGVLYPSDLQVRATVDSRLFFDASILFGCLKTILTEAEGGPTEKHIASVEDAYQILERYLNQTTYVACDHFTVADICVGATVTSLNVIVPIDADKFPRTIAWIGDLYAESCFPEINAPGVQEFNVAIHSRWNQPEGVQALGR